MLSNQKKFGCILSAGLILICLTTPIGWLNGNNAQLLTTAHAAENAIQFQGDTNEQLQTLLQERYEVLRAVAGLLNQQYSTGKVGILEIRDAIIDMLHAEADLRSTNSEKIKIYQKLVTILQEQDKALAIEVNADKVNQMDFLKARVTTLEAEIQLEKLKLPTSIPQ
ncbi:MAG: hypothetical protein GY774_31225 [Planctomycetes bacterium]|nr:hypothetical protein [Planctomycetota bacterium]